jgi:hypothetical protein
MQHHGWPLCYARCQICTSTLRIHFSLGEMLNLPVGRFRKSHMVNCSRTIIYIFWWWSLMVANIPRIHIGLADWAWCNTSSELSIWRTEFKAARNLHLLAGRIYNTYLGEIFNVWLGNAMILGKVSTSDRTIEPDLAQARNFPVGTLRSKLADAIIFQPEDSILLA